MRLAALTVTLVSVASGLCAQGLPNGPVTLAGGAVTLGGEMSVTGAPADDHAWFNYGDYDHDLMRAVRLGLSVAFRPSDRFALLASARAEGDVTRGGWYVRPYALFARMRPWARLPFHIQAGQLPPVFGAFGRQSYPGENPLIGLPLGYQYLTSLRADAVPSSADDLLKMRGRGWRVRYPIGSRTAESGVPLVDLLRYDTGVQARLGDGPVSVVVGLTRGTLSRPVWRDDNGGGQVASRLGWEVRQGLTIGLSAARGAFLADTVTSALPATAGKGPWTERAIGLDAEWSAGYWIVRIEATGCDWRLPSIDEPRLSRPVEAMALDVEARYKVRPGLYVAGRASRLDFSTVTGTTGRMKWDAPVSRLEIGAGYALQRNLLAKVAWQDNRRDGGVFARRLRLVAAQLAWWF